MWIPVVDEPFGDEGATRGTGVHHNAVADLQPGDLVSYGVVRIECVHRLNVVVIVGILGGGDGMPGRRMTVYEGAEQDDARGCECNLSKG